jgi:hypothetical protein
MRIQVLAPDPIVTGTAPKGAGWTTVGATRITLGPGETIYNLSKRYGVPASEIIKANNIADASRVSAGPAIVDPGLCVFTPGAGFGSGQQSEDTGGLIPERVHVGKPGMTGFRFPAPAPSRDVAVLPSCAVASQLAKYRN